MRYGGRPVHKHGQPSVPVSCCSRFSFSFSFLLKIFFILLHLFDQVGLQRANDTDRTGKKTEKQRGKR